MGQLKYTHAGIFQNGVTFFTIESFFYESQQILITFLSCTGDISKNLKIYLNIYKLR